MSIQEFAGPEPTLERIASAYSMASFTYNFRGMFILTFGHRTPGWQIMSFFKDHYGETHLDVPVGNGSVLYWTLLARRLARLKPPKVLEAVDYSSTMVGHAKRTLKGIPGLNISQADVAKLPFADSTFDTINVANGLHCFPDPPSALRELRRVLKSNGTIALNILLEPRGSALNVALANPLYRWARKRLLFVNAFSVEALLALFAEEGFAVRQQDVLGNTLNVIIAPTPG